MATGLPAGPLSSLEPREPIRAGRVLRITSKDGGPEMWISLFAVSFAVAIGLGVAAVMMQPKDDPSQGVHPGV